MKATVYIEIPIKIKINHIPGEEATHDHPGCVEEFEYMGYDKEDAAEKVADVIGNMTQNEIDIAGIEALEQYTKDVEIDKAMKILDTQKWLYFE